MWYLVSQVGTPTLGGGCLFPEGSIGSFGLWLCGNFVGESVLSGRLEESWRGESLYDCLGTLSGNFGDNNCDENSE